MPAKKKPTEQQLENLRKGFEALKAKRKKAEEQEDSPTPTPEPPPVPAPAPEPVPLPTPIPPPPEVKVKKERKKRVQFDPQAFRESLVAELRPAQPASLVTERVVEVEKPVEKVVYKERLLTGSEILNKLFNF